MIIFYDSSDSNRVKAMYSEPPNSKAWDAYGQVIVAGPILAKIDTGGTLTISAGVVTDAALPIPPAPTADQIREKDLAEKVKARTATSAELMELIERKWNL